MKQVDKSHYQFQNYMSKARWCSLWHQLDEILRTEPEKVLEIGQGQGLLKAIAAQYGIRIETLDLDPELNPDHIGSATEIPLADSMFDVVCAFQMLEHLPYDLSLQAFREMARVCRKHVIISLPDAKHIWRYQFHVPKIGPMDFLIPRPSFGEQTHKFDGEHYWEINKKGYGLDRVTRDFSSICRLIKTYRVSENPYHRFFVFEK
ncbi:MAG: class I SAM-dependent methyltransferase [Azonexus sp.]